MFFVQANHFTTGMLPCEVFRILISAINSLITWTDKYQVHNCMFKAVFIATQIFAVLNC